MTGFPEWPVEAARSGLLHGRPRVFGQAEQYDELTGFIEDLLHRVAVPRERLFVVPGNHDIDQIVAEEAFKTLRELQGNDAAVGMTTIPARIARRPMACTSGPCRRPPARTLTQPEAAATPCIARAKRRAADRFRRTVCSGCLCCAGSGNAAPRRRLPSCHSRQESAPARSEKPILRRIGTRRPRAGAAAVRGSGAR